MEDLATMPSSSMTGPPQKRRRVMAAAQLQDHMSVQHSAHAGVFSSDYMAMPIRNGVPPVSLRQPSTVAVKYAPHQPALVHSASPRVHMLQADIQHHAHSTAVNAVKEQQLVSLTGDLIHLPCQLPSGAAHTVLPPSLGLAIQNLVPQQPLSLSPAMRRPQPADHPAVSPHQHAYAVQDNTRAWVLGSQAAGQTHPANRAWVSFRVPNVEPVNAAPAHKEQLHIVEEDPFACNLWDDAAPEESTGSVSPEADDFNAVTGPIRSKSGRQAPSINHGAEVPAESNTNGSVLHISGSYQEVSTSGKEDLRTVRTAGAAHTAHGTPAGNSLRERVGVAKQGGDDVRGMLEQHLLMQRLQMARNKALLGATERLVHRQSGMQEHAEKGSLPPSQADVTGLGKLRRLASELNEACLPQQQPQVHSPLLAMSGSSPALQGHVSSRLATRTGVKRPAGPDVDQRMQDDIPDEFVGVRAGQHAHVQLPANTRAPHDSAKRQAIDAIRLRLQQHHQQMQRVARLQSNLFPHGVSGQNGMAHVDEARQQPSSDNNGQSNELVPGAADNSPRVGDVGQTSSATVAVFGPGQGSTDYLHDRHAGGTSGLRPAQQTFQGPSNVAPVASPAAASHPVTAGRVQDASVHGMGHAGEVGTNVPVMPAWAQAALPSVRQSVLGGGQSVLGGVLGGREVREAGLSNGMAGVHAADVLAQHMGFEGELEGEEEASMLLVNVRLRQQLRVLQKLCLLLGRKLQGVQQQSVCGLEALQKQLAWNHAERERLATELEAACRHACMLSDGLEREKLAHQRQLAAVWEECCTECRDRIADNTCRHL